jgi:arylsulfatase A
MRRDPTALAVGGLAIALGFSLACSSAKAPSFGLDAYGGGWVCGAGGPDQPEAGVASPSSTPNVIIILTDDQGYADVGCFGAQGFATPNLDRMAEQGIKFTDFYSVADVCSPSRAALMTGSYPIRIGITDVLYPESSIGLNPQEVTIAELLKCKGYATAAVGKWHLGDDKAFLPTRQGFDTYFGLPYPNDESPLPLLENEEPVEWDPDQSQLTRRYTERACDFIAANRQNPFFLYLAHTMPHVPLAVSADFAGRSGRGLYGDVIMELDGSVGRILDTLDELGIAGNTLVAFASDNGPWLLYGDHGGSAGPFREGKLATFEGGLRVPGIMRWPGRVRPDTVSGEIVTMMDLLPTVAEATGAGLPPWTIDGKSLLPILDQAAGSESTHDVVYFYQGEELQALRRGAWKLHLPHRYLAVVRPGSDGNRGEDKWLDLPLSLYDLGVDPGETSNLAAQYPDLVKELKDAAAAFDAEVKRNRRPPGRL